MSVSELYRWDTQYNGDSVEFCPVENFRDFLAVGTYQLIEGENRKGKLYLQQLKGESLQCLHTIETAAIFDMKWCHHLLFDRVTLGVVNAKGQLQFYHLNGMEFELWLQYEASMDAMILSLDWSTNRSSVSEPLITLSNSKGYITVLQIGSSGFSVLHTVQAHNYEAWITAFNYWMPNVIYSGGDDNKFKGYDMRTNLTKEIFCSTEHTAGVTSLHSACLREHVFASGSYDESVRVWDTRLMRSPSSSLALGGGVWRLKWKPQQEHHLLAACMHNGCHIINAENVRSTSIAASFTGHQSLAYGIDWQHGGRENIVASVSFYDHLLCLWKSLL